MKKRLPLVLLVSFSAAVSPALAQEPSLEQLIAAAVLPLPTALREEAGVWRWAGDQTEQLRESRNGMSCRIDDPSDDRFDVRCYNDEFWVVIRRGLRLRRILASREEVAEQLLRELDDGELQLPSAPTAGYRMLGPIAAYDTPSNEAGADIRKWQSIHFPFKTADEMGLPEDQGPNAPNESNGPNEPGLMPFVMASGTWWSHVMIVHEARE